MDAPGRVPFWKTLTERHLAGVLFLYFVVLSFQYTAKITSVDHDRPEKAGTESALLRWRNQLADLQDGEDIYKQHAYPNPPIMALLLVPVVEWPEVVGLPPIAAALGWFSLKVALTFLALSWVFRMVERPDFPFPLWAKILTTLLSLRAITGDLSHGNVNLFILFLVVGFLYALQRRRDLLAGLVLALAISCKVTPALFVPYLLWKRSWLGLVGCVAGMALFFWPGVVPALFLGWSEAQQLTASWLDCMVRPFVVDGFVTSEHHNQSLPGLVYRLFTESPSFVKYPNNVWTPDRFHNVAALSLETARALVKLGMGLFALLIVWTCRTPRDASGEKNPALAAEFALVAIGMLLFSERTWKHHCVTLLVPFAVLSYHLALWWNRATLRRTLIGSLAVTLFLMTLTSISLLGREGGKLAQVYGAYVGAFLVLVVALAVILRRAARDDSQGGEGGRGWLNEELRQAG